MPDTQQSNTPAAPQTTHEAPEIAEAQLGQVYKDIFNSLTINQQLALFRGRVHLPPATTYGPVLMVQVGECLQTLVIGLNPGPYQG